MSFATHTRNQPVPGSALPIPGSNGTTTGFYPYGPWSPCYNTASLVRPGCGKPLKPLCDVQKIGSILRGILPQTVWTITPAPLRANVFQGLAMRNTVSGNLDPSVNGRLLIQSVTVNQTPQEAFSTGAAIPVTTGNGVWTDDYTLPDGYGVPISWAPFSQVNLIEALSISGVSLYPAGGLITDYQVSIYGNAIVA